MGKSDLERALAFQLQAHGLPAGVPEYMFSPGRRWRFDFAWPGEMLAVEIEGGIWQDGRHTRGSGFRDDCVKYNEALLLGWRVLRVTDDQVKSGRALEWIRRGLGGHDG